MARRYLTLRGEQMEVQLRLTLRSQRSLRDRFQEDILQTVFLAASDSERMAALLGESLNWAGNHNAIQDGEELYDLLVDWGYRGQEGLGGIAFELAAASGLITEKQCRELKGAVSQAMEDAFHSLKPSEGAEESGAAVPFPKG